MTDFDEADVAAMRAEAGGQGFREFMRMQIAAGKARRTTKPEPPPPPLTGRAPGAWPTSTEPQPQPCTRGEWDAHIAEYRTWLTHREGTDR